MVKILIIKICLWWFLLFAVSFFASCCSEVSSPLIIEPLIIKHLTHRDSINNKSYIDRGRLPFKTSYYLVSNFTNKQEVVLDSFACANKPSEQDMNRYQNIEILFFRKTDITNNVNLNELPGYFDDYTERYDFICSYYWGTRSSCKPDVHYSGKSKNGYTWWNLWFVKLVDRLTMRMGGGSKYVGVPFECL